MQKYLRDALVGLGVGLLFIFGPYLLPSFAKVTALIVRTIFPTSQNLFSTFVVYFGLSLIIFLLYVLVLQIHDRSKWNALGFFAIGVIVAYGLYWLLIFTMIHPSIG